MDLEIVRDLFAKYIDGKASNDEIKLLLEYVDELSNSELENVLEPLAQRQVPDKNFDIPGWEIRLQKILSHPVEKPKLKVIAFRKWKTIMAAAAFIGLIVTGYLLFSDKSSPISDITNGNAVVLEIPPGKEGAILKLSDGSEILLDDLNNGAIAKQGITDVVKMNGQIVYDVSQTKNQEVEVRYNTLSTPKGRQFALVLPDGSKVWLNAASSIRFPTIFAGHERRVEVTGEAYFEVNPTNVSNVKGAANSNTSKKIPFIVSANGMQIEVLGTHFNINSYEDEKSIKTTLIEGSVKIKKADHEKLLKPGQQAVVPFESDIIVLTNNIDVQEILAWKNGQFIFNSTDIQTIMRQVSRWYDIEVEFKDDVQVKLTGMITRQVKASEVLNMLEQTGAVKLTIQDKKVIVRNK